MELADGTIIPATLVVMAVGIRPNAALAKEAGIAVNRGIVVDAGMRSNDPDIYALGECAEVNGQVYGLVAPLYEMARVAASQLAGDEAAAFVHIGHADQAQGHRHRPVLARRLRRRRGPRRRSCCATPRAGVYKRLVLKDDRIIGTVLYGETADGAWFNDLKKKQTDISRDARHADLRPVLPGGCPAGPYGGRCSLAG